MKKKVHWLISETFKNPIDLLSSNLASIRLRAGIFFHPCFESFNITFGDNLDLARDADFLFVSKIGANKIQYTDSWVKLIANHKKYFIDYTDDHLNSDSNLTFFYKSIFKFDSKIITSSNLLKEKLLTANYKNISLIEDPYEIEKQAITTNNNLKFLWFGHESNKKYLYKFFDNLNSKDNLEFFILCSYNQIEIMKIELSKIKNLKNYNFYIDEWSPWNMIEISKKVSGILIPGDIKDKRKNGVSNNRLITSIALGLPVAASYYDSYIEFKDYFCNIDSETDLDFFIKDTGRYRDKLRSAQSLIDKFSFDAIAKKWLNLLKQEDFPVEENNKFKDKDTKLKFSFNYKLT